MREISRRGLMGLGAGAAAAMGLAACGSQSHDGATPGRGSGTGGSGGVGSSRPSPRPTATTPPLGDGSTADTGKQPNQPEKPRPLEPGETPPQFVVFSWDGAGEVGNGLFPRFLDLAKEHGAHMTFFLSGLYLLPESKKRMYLPPNNAPGASDIGYLTDAHIRSTLENVRRAWLEGHEIGTHFNGHFCSGFGTVANWTPKQWRSEIEQAKSFVKEWRTNTGFTDLPTLPFDYDKELIGGRAPCLLGQDNLLPTARELGWRYDASSPGGRQRWPGKRQGLWDFPLQLIPFPGHTFEVLSMDYNMLANQSIRTTQGPSYNYPGWRTQAANAYISGFKRAYETNRAPFFVGNHFEHWNGGIYMDAVEEAFTHIAREKEKGGDVRLVSFRQFTDWLDVQKPEIVRKLQTLDVGQRPAGGWKEFLADVGTEASGTPSNAA
ncbi:polysaccharide deacetylase family protein [Streptomyces chiangmaiensis]|uniref:Polysaccharide deacetylase family protein n=1 Tax=Streptomyces chiangmaiensis TaxID=766497 RepID=A0ABU7FDB8_9ACTN|nr:polysaccharide deacetylase family protein [Streptomyces chiangmaiensis]MED7821875.1 polysaccharide deacetylase family protein [Streptomyces chiangmaiensis]